MHSDFLWQFRPPNKPIKMESECSSLVKALCPVPPFKTSRWGVLVNWRLSAVSGLYCKLDSGHRTQFYQTYMRDTETALPHIYESLQSAAGAPGRQRWCKSAGSSCLWHSVQVLKPSRLSMGVAGGWQYLGRYQVCVIGYFVHPFSSAETASFTCRGRQGL